ncbi:flavin reductase family protein [Halomonas litopenaei]|uniref:flavin reductase family protein n=1 Tax=Halomonas litopenaei TaxID=2109328 RepID=UPI003FA104A1
MSGEQASLSNQFARQGADKWHGIAWQLSPSGNPVIADCLHSLDCEIHAVHVAGNHLTVIGEVKALNGDDTCPATALLQGTVPRTRRA